MSFYTPIGLNLHLVVELSRLILFLCATIVLYRIAKNKGIYLMAGSLAWEILTAPIMWMLWKKMNQEFALGFSKVSWLITTLAFAGGLFLWALEFKKRKVEPSS